MSRLTRDGTAESVSRDQVLRRERGQGIFIFPVQLTTCRIGNLTRLIHTLAICDDLTYIYCCIHRSRAMRILLIYSTKVSTCSAESYIQLHSDW